jgi:hypothetical protein
MGARAFLRTVTVLCLAGFSLALFSSAASASECANEARRKEQNATYLPDCRAYEMVSPVDKKGSDVVGANNTAQIAASGERATFETFTGIGETHGSGAFGMTQYVTKRGSGGWGTPAGIDPQPTRNDLQIVEGATQIHWFSESFDEALVQGWQMVGSTGPDLPENANLYDEISETGALETITTPLGVDPSSIGLFAFQYGLRAASSDLGVVTFEGEENLMPGLPAGEKLYEWNHGKLEVAGVLPDETLPAGGSGGAMTIANGSETRARHAVSADGSRVLFRSPTNGSKPTQLYIRRDSASTGWVSQSEASTPNLEPKGVEYLDMSADGNKVLFASQDPLTDSDPGGSGHGIYLYTDGPQPEVEQNLTFIARVTSFQFLEAFQIYTGMSEDAKRIYFFSEATAELPQEGTYVWDEGTVRFVAATGKPLISDIQTAYLQSTIASVSSDGKRVAFISPYQLTEAPLGPDATSGGTGLLPAMYLYDEESGGLTCVSCLPTGAPTTSAATVWPAADEILPNNVLWRQGKFLSQEGRYVFFSTVDALVPGDVNGVEDVYEYDSQTGHVALLSSGTSGDGSWFSDASPDGSNVVFDSRSSYLRQDVDRLIDVYDVRVGGGFPQPLPSTGGCVGDECQGLPSPVPSFNTASGFTGLGNIVQSAPGKAKPRGLTRAQKLKRALRVCKRRHGEARRRCEATARQQYGAHKASKGKSHATARG